MKPPRSLRPLPPEGARPALGRPGGRPGPASFVYLASQSPRRSELLTQIGVRHELLVAGLDEDVESLEAEVDGELPAVYVERVTRATLVAARRRRAARSLPEAPLRCADTTVARGRRMRGKPADAADAARILALLAGRTHRVITAVAVARGANVGLLASVSRVRFASLSAAQIDAYVAGGEPFGKAGAYAIQSAAAAWVERIEGSYTGIMGLPLHETATLLRWAGVAGST